MLRFGQFEVDFAKSELRKGGTRVRIQEQPLRILETLVARRGEIVSREELRDRLWPADTFVDFDGSLNAAIGKLRQSLSDSADRPRYVETVARKGYRFIAPVTESEPPIQLPEAQVDQRTAPEVGPPMPPGGSHRWLWWAAAALALLCFGLLWQAKLRPPSEVPRRVVLLDLDVGNEVSQPAISPDGSTMAFIAGGQLAVRQLDRPKITTLSGTEGASSPFFSPDGKWVGYFANHELRKVTVEGGESVMLCSAPIDRGGTWTEEGQIVAALSSSGELFVVPSSGGSPQALSNLRGEPPEVTNHRMPVALPSGKGILFVSSRGTSTGALRVLKPGGGAAKTLVQDSSSGRYLSSGHLLFVQGETMFAAPMDLDRLELTGPATPVLEGVSNDHFRGPDFDVSASGTLVYRAKPPRASRVVAWLDPAGNETRILAKTGAYASPRLSLDGKRLTLTSGDEVWFYELAKNTIGRLAFAGESRCCPVWSPDGEYVAFSALSTLTWTKWDASGPVDRLPPVAGRSAVPFSFSPDGKWLAFHRNETETGYDLWAAPVDRTGAGMRLGPPQLLLRQPGLQAAPAISPDGRWLAYGSDEETGRMEVYVIPFTPESPATGRRWRVSTDGGRGPRWARNGGEIFYRAPDETLMVAAAKIHDNAFQPFQPRVWSTKRLAKIGPFPNFDVGPDGKRVIAILDGGETKPDETHLRVLLNLSSELRRQRSSPQ